MILVSFTFEKSCILLIAVTNKNIIYFVCLELANSVFQHLVLLSFTQVASNSFSFLPLRSSYTVTLSSTCFFGRRSRCWKTALESLLTFTLPVFRTKQGASHKGIQPMKGFHFPSTRTTNSVRLILGSQYSLCENQTSPSALRAETSSRYQFDPPENQI